MIDYANIPAKLYCECGKAHEPSILRAGTEDMTVTIKCRCGQMRIFYPNDQPGSYDDMMKAALKG